MGFSEKIRGLDRIRRAAWASSIGFLIFANTSFAIEVGVHYYPGWTPDPNVKQGQTSQPLPTEQDPTAGPWDPVKNFPERRPLLGYYDATHPGVVDQQLRWMNAYGIDFVVFNWFWSHGIGVPQGPMFEQTLDAYLQAPTRSKVAFYLFWDDHSTLPATQAEYLADFDKMVDYWIDHFLGRSEMYRIGGRPVIAMRDVSGPAQKFGLTGAAMIARAQARVQSRHPGWPSIYFIAMNSNTAGDFGIYDGVSDYDYITSQMDSYSSMTNGYAYLWPIWLKNLVTEQYILPIATGWDHLPWGASATPANDNLIKTPALFTSHLQQAKSLVGANASKTAATVTICCWNEFGEGSHIEPSRNDGFQYLEAVKSVFRGTPSAVSTASVPGWIDAVDSSSGLVRGWSYDSADAASAIPIQFYLDGVPGKGSFIGAAYTDILRSDVNSSAKITGTHGWSFQIPSQYRDGKTHVLYAYAISIARSGGLFPVGGAPKAFKLGTNQPLLGNFEQITSTGFAAGWAMDPYQPNLPIAVRFYLDRTAALGGRYLGSMTADQIRSDLAAAGLPTNHGFKFKIPNGVRDGKTHRIYVYADDPSAFWSSNTGVQNVLLVPSANGKSETLAPNSDPTGNLEKADASAGVISGWVADRDTPSSSLTVRYSVYSTAGQLEATGSFVTNVVRPDVNQALSLSGAHGFSFSVPSRFRDGAKHVFFLGAVDTTSGDALPFSGSQQIDFQAP